MAPATDFVADRVAIHGGRTALVDARGSLTYAELDAGSARVAAALLHEVVEPGAGSAGGAQDLEEARVAFLIPPGRDYVQTLLGIWRAGGIAVPLATSHPAAELDYVLRDADVSLVIFDETFGERITAVAKGVGARAVDIRDLESTETGALPAVDADRRAMMLYTSGTTGKPKGVVTTHANLRAQILSLVEAWGWTANDRTLLVLPLHHVHGIVNVVLCALWSGAECEMTSGFDVDATWSRLASGELTVFTAVPTIYYRLIKAWESEPDRQDERSAGAGRLRLMMSGSSALPVATLARWREITGQVLLERYGMTEIGMALSNPLDGERRPGFVGQPLPGVDIRIVDEQSIPVEPGIAGEIEVRGPGVFREYWLRPEATRQAFRDGWCRTGDVAVVERDSYRLLGRSSVDIIKTGGFKVSAWEIEDRCRQHPAVDDCAVVGLDDAEWGQRICAALQMQDGARGDAAAVGNWLSGQLAPYKVPREYRVVDTLPRNAMGKVIKAKVRTLFQGDGRSALDAGNQAVDADESTER